jgi:hypothetical protein
VDRRLVLLVGAAALLLGLFTTYEHVMARGLAYVDVDGEQWRRLQAFLAGEAGNPIQYRVLTSYLLALSIRLGEALALPHPVLVSFVGLRIVEDTAIFALAFAYYRALGLSVPHAFLGLSLLAWGMSYGHHNADLRHDTYLDVACYLAAAQLILAGRYAWLTPLTLVAALNRETSGLIPFLLLAHLLWRRHARPGRSALDSRELLFVALPLVTWLAVFVGLRLAFPAQRLLVPNGVHQGLELLVYNLTEHKTWVQLVAVLGILPALALWAYPKWPDSLRAFALALVPVWFAVHFVGAVAAESRLFLVPQALVFVPGALFLAQAEPD